MGWDTRMKHARACAAFAAAMMLLTAISAEPVYAQEAPAPQAPAPQAPAAKATGKAGAPATPAAADAAQKQKEAEAAKRAYEAGAKSYQAGKFEPAVQSLSAALRGGGLSSQDMARGLYFRGLAYKKQAKPGLAISDLTSALWLKNGLNDADRQSATSERAEAYKMAGLGDGNSGPESVAVADPNAKAPPAAAPVPAPVPNQVASVHAAKTVANESSIPCPFAVAEGPPQQARVTPKSTAGGIDQAAALEQPRVEPTTAQAAPAAAAAVPAPIPEQSPAQAATQPGNGTSNNSVAGFFSNLFGGSGEVPAEQAPVTTASTDQATSATSSWSGTTAVITGAKAKAAATTAAKTAAATPALPPPVAAAPVAKVAAATAPAPAIATGPAAQAAAPAVPQIKGGKYKVHIAALRSRPEAEALAQKLLQQHGSQLAARAPTVDEAIIGSMGKFYRVRVGSYATADEPRGLCNTLRNSGYDCLVVTN